MCKKSIYLVCFVLLLSLAGNASSDLLVHWALEEGSGTTAFDTSGNGNDGTFSGEPQWVDGHGGGGALEFDGVDDFVVYSFDQVQTFAAFSVAFWVKASSLGQPNYASPFTGHFPNTAGFQVDVDGGNPGNYRINPNSGNQFAFGTATTDWIHLALTAEGTSMNLYYNGNWASSNTLVDTDVVFNQFAIGVNRNRNWWFAGTIDELRVYDHVLSEAEILGAMAGEIFPYAFGPEPADGTLHDVTWANVSWKPGGFAVSHDVYFGENLDDVNAGAEGTFIGNQVATFMVIGFPGFAYPDGLVPGTTYYWRIDEVNDTEPNSPWKGDVWSFSIPPKTAYAPDPADGAELVDPDVELSWTGGFGSKLHTVYFGDNFDEVNNAAGGLPQGTTTYDPGPLKMAGTYYWRVDEFDIIETHKGDVWSFTTQGAVGSPNPSNGAVDVKQTQIITFSPGIFAASHQLYFGTDKDAVKNADTGSPEYKGTRDLGAETYDPGMLEWDTAYYWRIDEVNDTEPNSPWKGDVWSFMIPPKTAYFPDPADNAELVPTDGSLSWTGGFGSKLHTVYFGDNFDDVNNATGGLPQGATTYDHGPLKMAGTYYWRVDEFDAIEAHKGDVWSFITEGAVGSPDPANGAVDVEQTQIITFSPSVFAASHELYFGTDKDAVKNADTGSPEYKGTRDLGSESYDPGMLEWDTAYYWRIDEVNNTNPDSPWTGILWSFTTANFLVVDDFESYNDLDPAEPESNRIFNAWLDGFDDPTNGSLVGYDLPPFAEQTIVHGGNQSMPLYYDNSVGYSEATLTLTYPRDWTEKSVNTLTIWFRGDAANAAETLYVALNGNAIVTNDNPDAAQITAWTEWTIDLSAPGGFADQGVNLANVNTIALGLGNRNNPVAGGSGTMYFDDIRLYPPPPEPAP